MAEIQIPGVDFTALAREAIAHQVTKALVGSEAFVTTTIAEALARKVDSEGKYTNNRGYNELPFVQWVAEDLVRAAVRKAIAAKIDEMRPEIESAVSKALRAQAGVMAKSMVEAMTANMKDGGRWGVNVEFTRQR